MWPWAGWHWWHGMLNYLDEPLKLRAFMAFPWNDSLRSKVPLISKTKPSKGALRLTMRQKRKNLRESDRVRCIDMTPWTFAYNIWLYFIMYIITRIINLICSNIMSCNIMCSWGKKSCWTKANTQMFSTSTCLHHSTRLFCVCVTVCVCTCGWECVSTQVDLKPGNVSKSTWNKHKGAVCDHNSNLRWTGVGWNK